MVLGILMLFSIFYYTARELKTISISAGAVHFVSRFRWIRSRGSQSCCGCSVHWVFDVTGCWCCGKVVSVPIWYFRALCLLGVGEYVVPMLSTDGLFFDGGLLAGGAS